MPGRALTVLGPVPPDSLGVSLLHEHVVHGLGARLPPPPSEALSSIVVSAANRDQIATNPFSSVDNTVFGDRAEIELELDAARRAGVATIVEMTVAELGRRPEALRELSLATGVHLIASTGHYVRRVHPTWLDDAPVEVVAEGMLRELREGIGSSDVRAGTIKVGTSNPLHPVEARVLEAAAVAQQETGTAITVHLSNLGAPSSNGAAVLSVLEGAGGDPTRTVLAHLDLTLAASASAVEEHLDLARRGAVIGYDTCGHEGPIALPGGGSTEYPTDARRAGALTRIFEAGFGGQVIVSGDICTKDRWRQFGGTGYAHPLEGFWATLEAAGLTVADRELLLVETPRRLLATFSEI